ncbi:hypothetical protein PVK06_020412 [Gossypium arboreum]|uniref:Cytochrome f large domain-containing protein n=1 Tax=Gossypium arboreum TaxID=29729 RepID=A0ABR0PMP8_GOSAR|nr:hypothetical protein PVK06_020412 [Gossypium arboreum]
MIGSIYKDFGFAHNDQVISGLVSTFPVILDTGYENPREATGRIVCANCHLANKPVDIEVPQAVLPDTVFEVVVRISYDMQLRQVLATDPANNKDAHFLKYPIYVGENRGRGQIYPEGNKSNNTVYNATATGIGESIKLDQPLTINPNVGGFGQGDAKIVLQDPLRVQGLLFFLASIVFAQIFSVLRKKQFQKVQVSEMNF